MATQKGPGKSYRTGLSLIQLQDMFPDDATAEQWFVEQRWPSGIACVHCGSLNINDSAKHPTMPYHCRDCRKFFSVKTGTVMQSSKIGYRKWALAIYILTTGLKGTSSMKLHRDIGVTQKTAWHMAHRIRESWAGSSAPVTGPVEVDETFVGGKMKTKSKSKRRKAALHGPEPKTVVVGMKDRATGKVEAKVVRGTDAVSLKGFVGERRADGAMVFTDELVSYKGLMDHVAVPHGRDECVHGEVHTNGIESHWSTLKRGIYGTYHHVSPKHTQRYANEFAGRHNDRPADTVDQMGHMVKGMEGKRLRYDDLIADEAA